MLLDVRTLLVVYVAVSATVGGIMLLFWLRRRDIPGLGLWALGIGLTGLGLAISAARGAIPDWLSILVSNPLITGGILAVHNGLRRFRGAEVSWLGPALLLAGLTAYLAHDVALEDDLLERIVVTSVVATALHVGLAVEAWRCGARSPLRMNRVAAAVFAMTAVTLAARAVDVWRTPSLDSLFTASSAQSLHFLTAIVSVVLGSFALMTMANDWLQHRLEAEGRAQALLAEERNRAAEEAQLANRAKSEFLATVSHELRTPVNAILGGLDILDAAALDPKQRQTLGMMGTAGQSLLALLDDLLDVTRMEAGRLVLEPVDFDLHRRLSDAVALFGPRAAEKGLALTLDLAPDLPRHVRLDAARLRQILLNLLGNAVKFTEAGGITLSAGPIDPPAGAGDAPWARLTVRDTGIGIPADKLASIFDPFYQADGSITRRFGGAGLGLAICRRLAALMGGRVTVESAVGRGSAFHLDLPVPPGAEPAVQAPARALPRWDWSPTVLLVEDDATNRFVATHMLERQGVAVQVAESGAAALKALERGPPPDLVLMDLGMPDMDGIETTRAIRGLPPPACRVPILALTANVMADMVAQTRAAGMDGFVGKPIRPEELLDAMARFLPPGGDRAGAPQAAPAPRARGGVTLPGGGSALPPPRLRALRADLGDAVVAAMLEKALEGIAAGAADITAAAAKARRREVCAVAQRLVSTLGAIGLDDIAARLHDHARVLAADQDPDLPAATAPMLDLLRHAERALRIPAEAAE